MLLSVLKVISLVVLFAVSLVPVTAMDSDPSASPMILKAWGESNFHQEFTQREENKRLDNLGLMNRYKGGSRAIRVIRQHAMTKGWADFMPEARTKANPSGVTDQLASAHFLATALHKGTTAKRETVQGLENLLNIHGTELYVLNTTERAINIAGTFLIAREIYTEDKEKKDKYDFGFWRGRLAEQHGELKENKRVDATLTTRATMFALAVAVMNKKVAEQVKKIRDDSRMEAKMFEAFVREISAATKGALVVDDVLKGLALPAPTTGSPLIFHGGGVSTSFTFLRAPTGIPLFFRPPPPPPSFAPPPPPPPSPSRTSGASVSFVSPDPSGKKASGPFTTPDRKPVATSTASPPVILASDIPDSPLPSGQSIRTGDTGDDGAERPGPTIHPEPVISNTASSNPLGSVSVGGSGLPTSSTGPSTVLPVPPPPLPLLPQSGVDAGNGSTGTPTPSSAKKPSKEEERQHKKAAAKQVALEKQQRKEAAEKQAALAAGGGKKKEGCVIA